MDTLEIMDFEDDEDAKLLASPYLHKENSKSGNKCLWIGEEENDTLWTDKCDSSKPWQIWSFKPIQRNSDKFHLVHKYTGKCVRPISNGNDYLVQLVTCTSYNDIIWTWFEGL